MQIGRRIYYDKLTGSIVQVISERAGGVTETTIEQDFAAYQSLAERVPTSVGCMQLEYGQYEQDFAACNGYRVDVSGDTPSLLFSYPDPDEPEEPTIYQPPLSVKVAEQEQRIADVELALADLIGGGI